MFLIVDVGNFVVLSKGAKQPPGCAGGFSFVQTRRGTQSKQGIIRDPAERRAKHSGESQLVSSVIQKTQQLNQIFDFIALVEATTQYRLIRNIRATKNCFVDVY